MAVILGSTGITFPDATTQTTAASGGGFPAGTRMSFQQTAAPTGWTKDTTAAINDSALRFVTGAASSGGSVAFSTAFASQNVSGTVGTSGATTLSTAQIPSHTHLGGVYPYSGNTTDNTNFSGYFQNTPTGAAGGGGSHTHSGGTFSGTAINLSVKYYDFIIASKD